MSTKKKPAPGSQVKVGGLLMWIYGDVAMPLANSPEEVRAWLKVIAQDRV